MNAAEDFADVIRSKVAFFQKKALDLREVIFGFRDKFRYQIRAAGDGVGILSTAFVFGR